MRSFGEGAKKTQQTCRLLRKPLVCNRRDSHSKLSEAFSGSATPTLIPTVQVAPPRPLPRPLRWTPRRQLRQTPTVQMILTLTPTELGSGIGGCCVRPPEKILQRGEKLEDLEARSDELSESATLFQKGAKSFKRWHYMNQVRPGRDAQACGLQHELSTNTPSCVHPVLSRSSSSEVLRVLRGCIST